MVARTGWGLGFSARFSWLSNPSSSGNALPPQRHTWESQPVAHLLYILHNLRGTPSTRVWPVRVGRPPCWWWRHSVPNRFHYRYIYFVIRSAKVATRVLPNLAKGSSASVTESSGSAGQGAKTSASVDNLAPAQLHLVYNSTLNKLR